MKVLTSTRSECLGPGLGMRCSGFGCCLVFFCSLLKICFYIIMVQKGEPAGGGGVYFCPGKARALQGAGVAAFHWWDAKRGLLKLPRNPKGA